MAIDQLLKRNFWAVILVLLGIAAFFHAQAITQIVGAKLSPDESQLAVGPPPSRFAPATSAGPHSTNADAILKRNPFDSVTGPLDRVALEEASGAVAAANIDLSDPVNAPVCEGVKILVIAASPDPDWSFAAMTTGTDGKSMLRRRGGDVGGKTVKFVGWDRVWLVGGSGLCQAKMFAPTGPEHPAPVASAPPPPAAGGPGAVDPSISKGIQKISATEFNIDRGVVDKILENQAELMRQARIVPEQENGKMVGIRLFGVRPDTLLGVLGMQNGDRLQTINGFDMTSPEKALEAYARLRTADHLTVQVNRSGQNTNLDYNIK
jgi:general secretion pathway protein C